MATAAAAAVTAPPHGGGGASRAPLALLGFAFLALVLLDSAPSGLTAQ